MKKMIMILITLLLFTATAFADFDKEPQNSHDNEAVPLTKTLNIVPQTKTEDIAPLYTSLDISYPQIVGEDLSPSANEFNKLVMQIITDQIQTFKNSVTRDLPHMKTLPEEVRKNTLFIDYDIDVIYRDKRPIISIRFMIEGMQAGHVHPFHAHHVLNYDLNNKKILTLNDLFKSHSNYLRIISNYSLEKLTKKLLEDSKDSPKEVTKMEATWITEGTQPTPKNYQVWNIEDDGLLITFNEYQVASYGAGPQVVEIPYSVLKKILASDSH